MSSSRLGENGLRCETCAMQPPPTQLGGQQIRDDILIEIDTVVHVTGVTLTNHEIHQQICQLNTDFSATNSDVPQHGTAGNPNIQFRLIAIDRTSQSREQPAESTLLTTLHIFVVPSISGNTLGYARIPQEEAGYDCVVVRRSAFSDRARTVTHEVGHWLGLYHPFQRGGDGVADTPVQYSPQFGCETMTTFMDYSDDECMNRFTKGQVARMRTTWFNLRARQNVELFATTQGSELVRARRFAHDPNPCCTSQ